MKLSRRRDQSVRRRAFHHEGDEEEKCVFGDRLKRYIAHENKTEQNLTNTENEDEENSLNFVRPPFVRYLSTEMDKGRCRYQNLPRKIPKT